MAKLTRRQRRRKRAGPIVPNQVKVTKKEASSESTNTLKKDPEKGIAGFYNKQYKTLLFIPILLLIFSIAIIGLKTAQTGDFIPKGTALKGGVIYTITTNVDPVTIENLLLSNYPASDITVRVLTSFGTQQGIIIETPLDIDSDELLNLIENQIPDVRSQASVETIGSSLSENFFKQTLIAIIFSFVFMSIVVFIYYRSLVPAFSVILAAFSDIVMTLGLVNILDIKVTTAGIAAFLMLIGYSVDTNILLSTRVLKRNIGTVFYRVTSALKTGITMTVTTVVAISVALIFTDSDVIRQIMTILLIGLLFDVINTWILNASILRIYKERTK